MNLNTFSQDQAEKLILTATSEDFKDGTYIITGANAGLGYECAKHLMKLQAKRIILAVRSLEKGEKAKRLLETETKRVGVAEVWHLDMCSYNSVKSFAVKVSNLERVDAIIENVGIAVPMSSPVEGLEAILTVNVISTMLLAVLVLPKLQHSAKQLGKETHLSFVGSSVAFTVKGALEKFDGDLIEELSRDKASMGKRYPTSKLLELYAVRQLASLWPVSKYGVIINYINPGLCKTGLSNGAPFLVKLSIRSMLAIWGRTGEDGSKTLVYTTVSGKETHGRYISECRDKEFRVEPWVTNEEGEKMQNRVWESLSRKLRAIQPGCL